MIDRIRDIGNFNLVVELSCSQFVLSAILVIRSARTCVDEAAFHRVYCDVFNEID